MIRKNLEERAFLMGETVLLWLIVGMLAVSGAEGGLGASDGLRGAVGLGADCGGRTGGEKG